MVGSFTRESPDLLRTDSDRRVLLMSYVSVSTSGVEMMMKDKKLKNVTPTCFFANGSIAVIAAYICPFGIVSVNKHTIFACVSIRFERSPVFKITIRTIRPNKYIFLLSVRQTNPSAVEVRSCHETRDEYILFTVSNINEF